MFFKNSYKLTRRDTDLKFFFLASTRLELKNLARTTFLDTYVLSYTVYKGWW